MANDPARSFQALFRVSVVIGCVALLAGVAGVFHFGSKDRAANARRPLDASIVVLGGIRHGGGYEVTARWRTVTGENREEWGQPGADPATWYFRRAPEGVELELVVRVAGSEGPREVWRQRAILTRGAYFEVVLPRR